jgi:hypothetical protein
LNLAQKRRQGKLYPFQSSINLYNTVISTRSNSTVPTPTQSRDKIPSDVCQAKLSSPAATSDDTERFSSQLSIHSPQRSNTEKDAIITVVERLDSKRRSGSRRKVSILGNDLHNVASSISPGSPRNDGEDTPKLEMTGSSMSFVGSNSNAVTGLTADTCIIHKLYSSRGEVHALQGSFRSNPSDQSNRFSSDETIFKEGSIESGIDDGRYDLASRCAGSSRGHVSSEVSSSSAKELQVGSFHLHVYLEKSSGNSKAYTHANIEANYIPSKSIHREQYSAAIMFAPGEERVLLCRDYARDQGPQITIGDDHRGVVNIFCTWHRATLEKT